MTTKIWNIGDYAIYTGEGFIPYKCYDTEQVNNLLAALSAKEEEVEKLRVLLANLEIIVQAAKARHLIPNHISYSLEVSAKMLDEIEQILGEQYGKKI